MTNADGHVIPVDDLLAHDVSDDCICLPVTKAVQRSDGSYGWLVVHNAWDGRA